MRKEQKISLVIGEELERCSGLHYRFAKRLSRISSSPTLEVLGFSERKGKKYYTEFWTEGGKKRHRYLGTEENEEVRLIQEKHYLKKALSELERHMRRLNAVEEIEQFDCSRINEQLPKAYVMSEEHLKEIVGPDDEEKWYMEAVAEKAVKDRKYGIRYEEGRRHTAKDGNKTRSKSEVSIANEFFDRGKPYVYEMPVIVNHFLIHPDFMFYSNRYGRVIYWEHAGMLGEEKYMKDYSDRVDLYIRGGLVPGVDVIFTFDTVSGDLDTRVIKRLLDEYQ